MRRVGMICLLWALLLTAVAHVDVAHAENVTPPSPAPVDAESLRRKFPEGCGTNAEKIAEALAQDPEQAAAWIARMLDRCNCQQASVFAAGVTRATAYLRENNPSALQPMYRGLIGSCADCQNVRPHDRLRQDVEDQNAEDQDDEERRRLRNRERCERPDAARRQKLTDLYKIRAPRGSACFCSLMSSLGAQKYAQGQANGRGPSATAADIAAKFGLTPGDVSFGGGGISVWPEPVTHN